MCIRDRSKLFYLLLETPRLAEKFADAQQEQEIFQSPVYQKILSYMKEQIKRGILPTYAEIISVFPEDSAISVSYTHLPEIDGGIVVHAEQPLECGKFYLVAIEDANEYELIGGIAK